MWELCISSFHIPLVLISEKADSERVFEYEGVTASCHPNAHHVNEVICNKSTVV